MLHYLAEPKPRLIGAPLVRNCAASIYLTVGRNQIGIVALQWFIIGCVLLGTACAKIITLAHNEPLVEAIDPLLGVKIAAALAVATLVDLTAGLLLVLPTVAVRVKALVCLAVGLAFTWYHVAGMLLGGDQHCPCLGSLIGWLPVPESITRSVLLSFASYMSVAGLFGIVAIHQSLGVFRADHHRE